LITLKTESQLRL